MGSGGEVVVVVVVAGANVGDDGRVVGYVEGRG
jgi:hypothetical protein